MKVIFNNIDEKYPDKKKGVFLANDTYANMFLNLVIQKYGCLPDSYEIVGFDNSPIANARTAMDLLVKQMDNRKQRKPEPDLAPTHKKIAPVLIRRETTS